MMSSELGCWDEMGANDDDDEIVKSEERMMTNGWKRGMIDVLGVK